MVVVVLPFEPKIKRETKMNHHHLLCSNTQCRADPLPLNIRLHHQRSPALPHLQHSPNYWLDALQTFLYHRHYYWKLNIEIEIIKHQDEKYLDQFG